MTIVRRGLFVLTILGLCACASHKPKDTTADAGALTPDIAADAALFSSEGSDSQKIPGLNTIHFEFDRAVIDQTNLDQLKQNAAWIKSHPNVKIQIEGHCDQRGSVEYNLALGDRRAKAVAKVLNQMGVAKARLTTISYGEERPLDQGDSEAAYAKNRRANFVPLKMDSTPTAPLASGH